MDLCRETQEVEEQYLVEVLECLFHHILFHRSLGSIYCFSSPSFRDHDLLELGGKVIPRDAAILNNIFYVKVASVLATYVSNFI